MTCAGLKSCATATQQAGSTPSGSSVRIVDRWIRFRLPRFVQGRASSATPTGEADGR